MTQRNCFNILVSALTQTHQPSHTHTRWRHKTSSLVCQHTSRVWYIIRKEFRCSISAAAHARWPFYEILPHRIFLYVFIVFLILIVTASADDDDDAEYKTERQSRSFEMSERSHWLTAIYLFFFPANDWIGMSITLIAPSKFPSDRDCRWFCLFRHFIFHFTDPNTVSRKLKKNYIYNQKREMKIANGLMACVMNELYKFHLSRHCGRCGPFTIWQFLVH